MIDLHAGPKLCAPGHARLCKEAVQQSLFRERRVRKKDPVGQFHELRSDLSFTFFKGGLDPFRWVPYE